MFKRAMLGAAVLAAMSLSVMAEDAPKSDMPFRVEVTGDKLEAVQFKAIATRELRRQTPRDLAGEYALAFAQDSDAPENKALRVKLDALIAEFLHRMRCQVIDEPLVNKLEAGDKAEKEKRAKEPASSFKRKTLPPTVTGEEKQADGKVMVLMERVTETTSGDAAGKTTTEREVQQQRLLCVKSGEAWAVEKYETLETDTEALKKAPSEDPPKKWVEQDTVKQWFVFALAFSELDFKMETGTAESTARTVLTQTGGFGAEFALFFYFVGKMAPAILEVIKPLFTPESWKASEAAAKAQHEKTAKEKKEKKEPEKQPRAVEKHEKVEEGVEAFLFAPENSWAGKHWVKMKKTDKGWLCVELKKFVRKQVYDKEGNMTETWEEKPVEKFTDLDW